MFILGVLNTSHVDLIIGEDASPIGWDLPPNVSLWSEAGVLFRKSALKLKLLKKEAKNYVSCWSYWRGRVSNFWCTLSDWLGCLSKFLTLIWSFICRSIFKSLWSGVFLPLSFLITFSGVLFATQLLNEKLPLILILRVSNFCCTLSLLRVHQKIGWDVSPTFDQLKHWSFLMTLSHISVSTFLYLFDCAFQDTSVVLVWNRSRWRASHVC